MEFIDLKAQQQRLRARIEERICRVLDHGKYIMGPEVFELEEKLANFTGVKHAVSCSSGTDALLMALLALRVVPGDIVFVPAFTFVATAEVLPLIGATPAFVDIDPETWNLDVESLRDAISCVREEGLGRPRGVIAVDLFGLLADYESIHALAEEQGLFVIQDAAQSFGATAMGQRAGSNAPIATTSFFPAKPLGCYGDAGAVFTSDDEVAETLRSLRVHGGGRDKYDNVRIGLNGRCDTFQAAVLLEKLEIFEEEIDKRQIVAARYTDSLNGARTLQKIPEGNRSVWAQYSVLSDQRTIDRERLREAGVPTAVYYPKPLHHQDAFRDVALCPVSLSCAEETSRKIFSLPMHAYLGEQDQNRIVEVLFDLSSESEKESKRAG